LPGTQVIGSQFGDEGKGKVTDFYAKDADMVVRYQGGNNAGHTVVVGDKVMKLHLLPSGVAHNKKVCIGAGVVLDPAVIKEELDRLENRDKLNLTIDRRVNIIMPWHQVEDVALEGEGSKAAIGTTKRGIGPCYADRAARNTAIRFEDLVDEERLRKRIEIVYPYKKKLLEQVIGAEFETDEEEIFNRYSAFGKELAQFIGDVSVEVTNALDDGKQVMFEGAQGTFLDNDFGTFPYVTSSHPISGGAATGVGMPAAGINTIIGVVKAYTTRVGGGPFPTELDGEQADELRKNGNEFGTTTGRPRRVGWLDLPLLRTSTRINGFNELAITKLDVLCGVKKLKIAISYKINGTESAFFPADLKSVEQAEPVYKEFKGFEFDGSKLKKMNDLPQEALEYLNFIEEEVKVPIGFVGIGAERSRTLVE